ncbi:MAG: hypothetical protein PHS95_00655 [Candidatus Pacebacteria bacterium]|nr:hypothetical protein [Candidatus Paceibacterota bacterium]
MFGLNSKELTTLKRLNTPAKIQDFLDALPINYEKRDVTCMSPRRVLRERKAHCIEGAFLASVALMLQNKKPLILNLKVMEGDKDHIVILFKQNGYWGAISKTNHAVLRFRDPIYKTTRELALSYFHEYFLNSNGKKTLLGYSRPINLKKFGTKWATEEEDLWDIAEKIFDTPYIRFVPKGNERFIRKASLLERKAGALVDWKKTDLRT